MTCLSPPLPPSVSLFIFPRKRRVGEGCSFSIFRARSCVADRNIACCRCANDADFLFRSCSRCTLLTVPVTKLEKRGKMWVALGGRGWLRVAVGGRGRWVARPPVMLQATLSLRCPLPAVRCPTKCFVVPAPRFSPLSPNPIEEPPSPPCDFPALLTVTKFVTPPAAGCCLFWLPENSFPVCARVLGV